MKIITYATNLEQIGYVHGLVASCKYFGLDLVTLKSETWTSHRQKIVLLKAHLPTMDPEEVVFLADAYDVIMLQNEQQIMASYNKISKPGKIVMSADRFCAPDASLAIHFPKITTGYSYVSGGGAMGKVKDFIYILEKIIEIEAADRSESNRLYSWDDQYLWTKTIIQYPHLFVLDNNCEIFQTLCNKFVLEQLYIFKNNEPELSEDEDMCSRESIKKVIANVLEEIEIQKDGRVYNKTTKTYPAQLHFNTQINKLTMFMEPFVGLIERFNSGS